MNITADDLKPESPAGFTPCGGSDASTKSIAQIAVERYRDVLANVTRPYADQMASRPFDPLPLTASEQWMINDARQTADAAVRYEREHQNVKVSDPAP